MVSRLDQLESDAESSAAGAPGGFNNGLPAAGRAGLASCTGEAGLAAGSGGAAAGVARKVCEQIRHEIAVPGGITTPKFNKEPQCGQLS
jgi:hypothetical protein